MSLIHFIVLFILHALPHSFHHVLSLLKQDQATIYTIELIENQNDLNIVAPSKDDTFIKVIKNSVATSNVEPIENQEKIFTLMLSKDPCQGQSVPSSCSTIPCSLPFSTLLKSS